MIDFAVEHAAWLEVNTANGVPVPAALLSWCSEYNTEGPVVGPQPLKQYGNEYRLETNKQLYNGLRYAWLNISYPSTCFNSDGSNTCPPVTITGVRSVGQVLPLNYTGSFSSSDSGLDRIWYTGAYSVRVNLLPGFFGSELLDRGDRAPPFQGDAHVAQSVGLTAFASGPGYGLVRAMLNLTDSAARSVHDSNIATYPLQWVLSVVDYYLATNDTSTFAYFAPSIDTILSGCAANFYNWTSPTDLRWSGWDDRLGSGFWDVDLTPEARRFYWMTTLRAMSRFASAAALAGGDTLGPLSNKYTTMQKALVSTVRNAGAQWFEVGGYGLHSAAAAINGGWTNPYEQNRLFELLFNNSGTICSISNYDSGMILEALGEVGHTDYGVAMLKLCWGQQLSAGATCWWESTNDYKDMLANGRDADMIPGAQTSMCHAWGSYPTTWMTKNLAGLRPLLPGYTLFTVAPALGLATPWLTSINGTINTPKGQVTMTAELVQVQQEEGEEGREGGGNATLSIAVQHPEGLYASVRLQRALPGSSLRLTSVHLLCGPSPSCSGYGGVQDVGVHWTAEQVQAWPGESNAAGTEWVALPEDIPGCSASAHVITAVYAASGAAVDTSSLSSDAHYHKKKNAEAEGAGEGRVQADPYPFAPFGPPQWAGTAVGIDNSTHGSWVGVYGKLGYTLFSFDAGSTPRSPPTDRLSLPSFISAVAVGANMSRGRLGQDTRGAVQGVSWLQDPSNPSGPRSLGFVTGSDLYNAFIDVNTTTVNGAAGTVLSVYVADGGLPGDAPQSLIIHMEDGVTRTPLVPDTMVRHYQPPPAYGGSVPPYNAGGLWGLENGVYLRYAYASSLRIKIYCVAYCTAPVAALFWDAA